MIGALLWLAAVGPNVVVSNIGSFADPVRDGDFVGYAFGTDACNVGTEPLWWCNEEQDYCRADQHPVIAQNLYRLKDGRFEQIGMSWLKHGFVSVNRSDAACGNCVTPSHGGDQLGVGCADFYSSTANGRRPLGRRSEVDPLSVSFPFPPTAVPFSGADQLLRVALADIEPAQNPGARYFAEAHYLAADDAEAGNDLDNVSWREVSIDEFLKVRWVGETVRAQPAVAAWPQIDGNVMVTTVDRPVGGERVGRFHVAQRFAKVGEGRWRYDYTVHNLNARPGAAAFEVHFPGPTTISGAGFRGIAHHSGEVYPAPVWITTVGASGVRFRPDPHVAGAELMLLRWGTAFSFWFEADRDPMQAEIEVDPVSDLLERD